MMFDNVNGARLASKRIQQACGLKAGQAKELVARAGGWRDWHHLQETVGSASAPKAHSATELKAYAAKVIPDIAVDEIVRIVSPADSVDAGVPADSRWETIRTDGGIEQRRAFPINAYDGVGGSGIYGPSRYVIPLAEGEWLWGDLEDMDPEMFDSIKSGIGSFGRLPLGLFKDGEMRFLVVAVGDRIAALVRWPEWASGFSPIQIPAGSSVRAEDYAFPIDMPKASVFAGKEELQDLALPSRRVEPSKTDRPYLKDGTPAIVRTQVLDNLLSHAAERLGPGSRRLSGRWIEGSHPQPDWRVEFEAVGWSPSLHPIRIKLRANMTPKLLADLGNGAGANATPAQLASARTAFDEAFSQRLEVQAARQRRANDLGLSSPESRYEDLRSVVCDSWLVTEARYRRKRGVLALSRAVDEIHRYGHEHSIGEMAVGPRESRIFLATGVVDASLKEQGDVALLSIEVSVGDGATVFGNVLRTRTSNPDAIGKRLRDAAKCPKGLADRIVTDVRQTGDMVDIEFEPDIVKLR